MQARNANLWLDWHAIFIFRGIRTAMAAASAAAAVAAHALDEEQTAVTQRTQVRMVHVSKLLPSVRDGTLTRVQVGTT